MIENILNFCSLWKYWIECVIFLIFLISLSLLGLKWLIQEKDKKYDQAPADNLFNDRFKSDSKDENNEKIEDKDFN